MITDIKFDCTHCGQRMVVDSSAEGLETECPHCSTGITIPRRVSIHDAAATPIQQTGNGTFAHHHDAERSVADPEVSALRQELTEASLQLSQLENELVGVEQLKKEKRKLRDDLVRLKKDLTGKEADLAAVLAAREESESRAIALASELNRLEGELTLEQERGIKLQADVDAFAAERADVLPRLESAEREAESIKLTLLERDVELQDLRTNLTDTQAARTTALREIQTLELRITDLEAKLSSASSTGAQTTEKLGAATQELAAKNKRLKEVEASAKSLTAKVKELTKDRDALSKSLSKNTAGKDLVIAREELSVTTKERDRLGLEVERLNAEIDSAREKHRALEGELKSSLRELDEARRRAEAASEERLRQDNEVLRGIIARQNSELEQRHVQIVRLKRAQLGVRLAYAAFGIGLLAIAMWAMKTVPALNLGNIF